MARVNLHPPTRHHTKEERRKAEIPLGRARNSRWHFCRSHLSTGLEHRTHAVSARGCKSAEGKCFRKRFFPGACLFASALFGTGSTWHTPRLTLHMKTLYNKRAKKKHFRFEFAEWNCKRSGCSFLCFHPSEFMLLNFQHK